MGLFSPDRRRLTIASLMMFLGAVLHTIGNFQAPRDQGMVDVRSAMQAYHIALGLGMSPSMWDVQRTLVFTMSICLVGIAWLGWVVAGDPDSSQRLVTRVAWVGAAISGAVTVLSAYYQLPPPLITLAIVTAFYLFAAMPRSKR